MLKYKAVSKSISFAQDFNKYKWYFLDNVHYQTKSSRGDMAYIRSELFESELFFEMFL